MHLMFFIECSLPDVVLDIRLDGALASFSLEMHQGLACLYRLDYSCIGAYRQARRISCLENDVSCLNFYVIVVLFSCFVIFMIG